MICISRCHLSMMEIIVVLLLFVFPNLYVYAFLSVRHAHFICIYAFLNVRHAHFYLFTRFTSLHETKTTLPFFILAHLISFVDLILIIEDESSFILKTLLSLYLFICLFISKRFSARDAQLCILIQR